MFRSHPRFTSLLLGLALASASLSACATHADTVAPTTESAAPVTETERTPDEEALPRPFAESLAALDLRPEQKSSVEKLRADLRAGAAPVREARKQLALAVADGVARGSLSDGAIAAPMDQLTKATEGFGTSVQAALDKLHATLDASQRKALVEGVRERSKERFAANHEHMHPGHARLDKLATELGLTAEQIGSIRESFKAEGADGEREGAAQHHPRELRKHLREVAQAFEGDAFDAAALGVGKELPSMTRVAAARRVQFVERVSSVLTPEQRSKFAELIRAKAGAEAAADEE